MVVAMVVLAMVLSCLFTWVPGLNRISTGISVSLCAILAAAIGAWMFPVKEDA